MRAVCFPVISRSAPDTHPFPAMHLQIAEWGKILDRGIYKLPAMGPRDEFILFAVTSTHRLTPTMFKIVPFGGALVAALEELEAELQQYDPATDEIRRQTLKVS